MSTATPSAVEQYLHLKRKGHYEVNFVEKEKLRVDFDGAIFICENIQPSTLSPEPFYCIKKIDVEIFSRSIERYIMGKSICKNSENLEYIVDMWIEYSHSQYRWFCYVQFEPLPLTSITLHELIHHRLKKQVRKEIFTSEEVINIGYQIALGLQVIHHTFSVHYFIYPNNIYLQIYKNTTKPEDLSDDKFKYDSSENFVKLANYSSLFQQYQLSNKTAPSPTPSRGLLSPSSCGTESLPRSGAEEVTSATGMMGYTAPEIILQEKNPQENINSKSEKVDIYSLGSVLFQMITGERLHKSMAEDEQKHDDYILEKLGDYYSTFNADIIDLAMSMLQFDACKRPTIDLVTNSLRDMLQPNPPFDEVFNYIPFQLFYQKQTQSTHYFSNLSSLAYFCLFYQYNEEEVYEGDEKNEEQKSKWLMKAVLGKGAEGDVYLCEEKTTKMFFAVKRIKSKERGTYALTDKELEHFLMHEKPYLSQQLIHQNVLKTKKIFVEKILDKEQQEALKKQTEELKTKAEAERKAREEEEKKAKEEEEQRAKEAEEETLKQQLMLQHSTLPLAHDTAIYGITSIALSISAIGGEALSEKSTVKSSFVQKFIKQELATQRRRSLRAKSQMPSRLKPLMESLAESSSGHAKTFSVLPMSPGTPSSPITSASEELDMNGVSLSKNSANYECYVVMELCQGSLREIVEERKREGRPFSNAEVIRMAYQIANGLQYVHSRGMIHRDLKCENIMYADDEMVLKIGDLGRLKEYSEDAIMSFAGTISTIAPEIFIDRSEKYDQSVDSFSFGCILHELMTMQQKFFATEVQQNEAQVHKNLQAVYTRMNCLPELQNIVLNCVKLSPAKRVSSNIILFELQTLYQKHKADIELVEEKLKVKYLSTKLTYLEQKINPRKNKLVQ